MKWFVLCVALAVPLGSVWAGEESNPPKEPPTKDLVSAAKEAKSKRKKPSTKVITNADVKKSTGKLIFLNTPEGEAAGQKPVESETPQAPAKQELTYSQRLEAMEKLAAAEQKVVDLERELESIELQYYEENDPDRRDKLIRQQFSDTRRELEEARAELEAARKAVSTATNG